MLKIRALQIIEAVARLGGFSKAAKEVHAVQSTVSKAVSNVEEYYGIQIFDRLQNTVRLTPEGQYIYPHIKNICSEFQAIQETLAKIRSAESGELRIGFPPVASSILFAKLMAEYRVRYPGIKISLHEQGCAALEPLVQSGKLDLALSLMPVCEQFAYKHICDEPLFVLLPPDHHLGGQSSLKLDALDGSTFIGFEEGFLLNRYIASLSTARNLHIKECMRTGQMDFLITLVASGVGFALLPRLVLETTPLPQGITLALLDEIDLRWRAAIIWNKDQELSAAAQAWLDLLEENLIKNTQINRHTIHKYSQEQRHENTIRADMRQ